MNFLEVGPPQLERALRGMESLGEAERREPSAERQQQPYAPKFFSRREWPQVRMLADYVIPRDARSLAMSTETARRTSPRWRLPRSIPGTTHRPGRSGGFPRTARWSNETFTLFSAVRASGGR